MSTSFYLREELKMLYPFEREAEPLLIGKMTAGKESPIFTFALRFDELFKILLRLREIDLRMQKTIIDEYKKEYTVDEFYYVIKKCHNQIINTDKHWS